MYKERMDSTPPKFLNSIALLRVIAVLFVMYAHLVDQCLRFLKDKWWLNDLANSYFFKPLQINGGTFGVAIFFLVSGYIIPYVARHESLKEFALKRAFRIYPPFILSIAALVPLYYILDDYGLVGYYLREPESFTNVLHSALLTSFLVPLRNLNAVAWTLFVEVVFYIWIAAIFGLLFKRPVWAILATLGFLLFFFRGPSLFKLQHYTYYVGFMFLGTLFYLKKHGDISRLLFFIFTGLFWGLFLWMLCMDVAHVRNPFNGLVASYGFAYPIFATALYFEKKIKLGGVLMYISKTSYSLYLFHYFMGFIIVHGLHGKIGYLPALSLALLSIFVVCHFSFRLIERPSQALARELASRSWQGLASVLRASP